MRNKTYKNIMYTKARKNKSDVIPCYYCGKNLPKEKATVDHIKPISLGGEDKPSNFCISCFDCNNEKGGKTLGWFKPKLLR